MTVADAARFSPPLAGRETGAPPVGGEDGRRRRRSLVSSPLGGAFGLRPVAGGGLTADGSAPIAAPSIWDPISRCLERPKACCSLGWLNRLCRHHQRRVISWSLGSRYSARGEPSWLS